MRYFYKDESSVIYNQDNLDVMKSLPENYIDLIYCDILYGTGRNFGDYQDLKPIRKEIEEHYVPRIQEMKRILKSGGSIYLQMDSTISHWIRLIMDDAFGYENFVNEIIWHYSKMNAVTKNFISNHDNILLYGKSKNRKFNIQYTENESALRQRLNKFIFNDIIIWKSVKNHSSQLLDNYIKSAKNRLGKNELEDNDVIIDFKDKNKQKVDDVWEIPIIKGNSKEFLNYSTQKPKLLLNRIIEASSDKNDIVADFYMGSGTTAEVSKILGRKFIGCDINVNACELAKSRIINE